MTAELRFFLPLHVAVPPCAGFVRLGVEGTKRGGQQATVWVGQSYHHGMPPCLPPHCSETEPESGISPCWLLLYILSDGELEAGVGYDKSRNNQDSRLPTVAQTVVTKTQNENLKEAGKSSCKHSPLKHERRGFRSH